MARRQIEYVQNYGNVTAIELGARSAFRAPGDVLLHLPPPPPAAVLDGSVARRVASQLADKACVLIDQLQPGVLVLVGGDTAIHVLERLGIAELNVIAELLPGMPLTHGYDAAGHGRWIVLKAGNHGHVADLATLLQLARST